MREKKESKALHSISSNEITTLPNGNLTNVWMDEDKRGVSERIKVQ